MFTVECPECKGSYQVDERRIPATGLRMRCPKCSAAFVVQKPDATGANATSTVTNSAEGVGLPATKTPLELRPPPRPAPAPSATGEKKPGVPPIRGQGISAGAAAGEAKPKPAPPHPANKAPPAPSSHGQPQSSHGQPQSSHGQSSHGQPQSSHAQQARTQLVPTQPAPARRATDTVRELRRIDDDLLPQTVPEPQSKQGPATTKPAGGASASSKGAASRSVDDDLPELALSQAPPADRSRGPSQRASFDDSDLPIVRDTDSYLPAALEPSRAPAPGSAGAPRQVARTRATPDELDLPLFVPQKREQVSPEARVAQRRPTSSDPLELDLPSPLSGGSNRPAQSNTLRPSMEPGDLEFELPSPLQTRKTQDQSVSDDLPAPVSIELALPSVQGRTDVSKKTLRGTGNTVPPMPSKTLSGPPRLPEIDLGLDFEGTEASERPIESGSVPPALLGPSTSLPPALGGIGTRTQTERPLESLAGSISSPPPVRPSRRDSEPPMPQMPRSEALGGTGYGEVRLEPMGQDIAVDTDGHTGRRSVGGEGLEFGGVPEAEAVPIRNEAGAPHRMDQIAIAQPPLARAATAADVAVAAPTSPAKSKRSRIIVGVALSLIIVAGSALTLVQEIGPFGAHLIADQIHRKDHQELLKRYIDAGHTILAKDDYSGVAKNLASLEAAQHEHERLRELRAYYAFFVYSIVLRHGSQPREQARAKVLLDELGERHELKYLGIARSMRAMVEGNLAKARQSIAELMSADSRNSDAVVVSAEISMLERRYSDALQAWQQVDRLEQSARASYGLARAHYALAQYDAAKSDAEVTLGRNPRHVGARLILARVALEKQRDVELAQKYALEALSQQDELSVAEFVGAKTLSGDLHLIGSRISLAEAAYQEALAKDPRSSGALRGLGETLYRAGRYSESLARFEAGLQADPDDVMVAVGVAKAQLALERIREAGTVLTRLRQGNPKNYAVNYWYGRTEEAAGDREEAEKAYAAAIEVGGTDPMVVDAYVAMALLKNQQGRREEAQKVLATAQEKLPRMPKIHDAIGQLALAEGRYASAVEQFKQALALDSKDLSVKFRLGTALRKNRKFDAAAKVFEEVAAIDRDYPGLALERGQLYEASGQTEEALRAFESALAKAPNDPDLMLRVGCGKITAGRPQEAEQLLKKVLEQRPTSAETHHCLGRAQLLDGSNLATALRTLERAVELDPHRAEYHLYVGWAANEAGRVALAEQALKKALELDQGLGDAYWQRGILRYRQGAVKDAVADLTRALELMPGRYEAHAALADAYFDLGFEQKALEQWRLATVAQPDNATWRYRYGKLLQAAHRDNEARLELEAALELASKQPTTPRWAWEAHHLLARAIGLHPTAIGHWEAFLELAPRDNAYREEAKQTLSKLGKPWSRD